MDARRLLAVLLIALVTAGGAAAQVPGGYTPREGDVIFQSFPHSPLTDAIETATDSPFSHCGLVVREKKGFAVLEAIGPVTPTPLAQWIARGRDGGFAVYRLKPEHAGKIAPLVAAARRYQGRPYDIRYRFDDERIYCSELIYKAYRDATGGEELGEVRRLGDLKWQPVEDFIRKIEGGGLPLEREMITPRDLSEAVQLEPVLVHQIDGPTGF